MKNLSRSIIDFHKSMIDAYNSSELIAYKPMLVKTMQLQNKFITENRDVIVESVQDIANNEYLMIELWTKENCILDASWYKRKILDSTNVNVCTTVSVIKQKYEQLIPVIFIINEVHGSNYFSLGLDLIEKPFDNQVTTNKHCTDWIPSKCFLELKRDKVTGDDVCQAIDYCAEYKIPVVIVGNNATNMASRGVTAFNKAINADLIVLFNGMQLKFT